MTVSARGKCIAVWKLDKFSVRFDESKPPVCNHGHRDASSLDGSHSLFCNIIRTLLLLADRMTPVYSLVEFILNILAAGP